ncbi:MAG: HD-GYP domain-containing protein [Gemmatimonadota bacterium]
MRKLELLTAALFLAATLAAHGLWELEPAIQARHLLGLLLFVCVNLAAETKPLLLPTPRGNQAEITISGLSSYALVALFPPLHAAIAGSAAVFLTEAFVKRKGSRKSVFNTAQTFLSLAAAAVVFELVMRHTASTHVAQEVPAMAAAVVTYFVVNTGLVSLALSCLHGTPYWSNWAAHYRWEVLYVVCSIPLALLLVVAYRQLWLAGPVLFLGPLFLLREAYAQYVRLKTNYTETVRTLVKVIETHDTYTAGHSLRVAEYAKRLALALRLPMREVERIEIAAYLHDLGKVDLAITNLVRKPDRLTAEERTRMELHPIVSAELAAQVSLFRGEIEDVIRYHHENHDGSGYPYGLGGDEIPVGARILHVVDVFDAMASKRVYREAMAIEEVKESLRGWAGSQFDPRLVEVFLEQCVRDESTVLEQVEPAYQETLERKVREARESRDAARARRAETARSCERAAAASPRDASVQRAPWVLPAPGAGRGREHVTPQSALAFARARRLVA